MPFRHFGEPLLDVGDRLSYRVLQTLYDSIFPKGRDRCYWKFTYLRATPLHRTKLSEFPWTWRERNLVREALGANAFERLLAIKRHYDFGNVFHMNQNIRP